MTNALRHCGLDFGTSNTTLAVARGNAPARLLPLEDDKPTIPSVIFFDFEDERALQKRRFAAEFFPAQLLEGATGRPFLRFFQLTRDDEPVGLVAIDLETM